MFYSHILKKHTGNIPKFLLLFIDALLAAYIIIYLEERIIMLFYAKTMEPLSLLSKSAMLAFLRTTSILREHEVKHVKTRFVRVLLYSLLIGIIAGILTNVLAVPHPGIPSLVAVIGVSLLSAILMICAYYVYKRINK